MTALLLAVGSTFAPVAVAAAPSFFASGVSSVEVVSGAPLSLYGVAPADTAGRGAVAQLLLDATWVPVGRGTVQAGGWVSLPVPSYLGQSFYRIVLPAGDGQPLLVSRRTSVLGRPGLSPSVNDGTGYETVSGQLPEAVRRPVELHSQVRAVPQPTVYGSTDDQGRFSITKAVTLDEYLYVVAPALTVGSHSVPSATSLVVLPQTHPDGTGPTVRTDQVDGVVGRPFDARVLADGRGTVRYAAGGPGLPVGLTLDPATGVVSGTPTAVGVTSVPLVVTDAAGSTSATIRVVVDRATPTLWPAASQVVAPLQANADGLSADGRFVLFTGIGAPDVGESTEYSDAFLWDRVTGARTEVARAVDGGPANAPSFAVSLSPDGRTVTFQSDATNLTPDPDPPHTFDTFTWDRITHVITRVPDPPRVAAPVSPQDVSPLRPPRRQPGLPATVSTVGASADGRYVLLRQQEGDVHDDLWRYDRTTSRFVRVDGPVSGAAAAHDVVTATLSADGRRVLYVENALDPVLVLVDVDSAKVSG